uniref:Uncharacterized protein n=1 Tax=Rhizophora mucronata TaxID=61149 RepID=A0A2P2NSL9_RHIMU
MQTKQWMQCVDLVSLLQPSSHRRCSTAE